MSEKNNPMSFEIDEEVDFYFYIAGWILIAVFAVILLIFSAGGESLTSKVPPCALHAFTGWYCFGCGGTRAIEALLQGRLLKSLYYHPVVPYGAVVGGWYMISHTIMHLSRGRYKIGMHFRPVYLWIALAIVFINWAVKNYLLLQYGIGLL